MDITEAEAPVLMFNHTFLQDAISKRDEALTLKEEAESRHSHMYQVNMQLQQKLHEFQVKLKAMESIKENKRLIEISWVKWLRICVFLGHLKVEARIELWLHLRSYIATPRDIERTLFSSSQAATCLSTWKLHETVLMLNVKQECCEYQ